MLDAGRHALSWEAPVLPVRPAPVLLSVRGLEYRSGRTPLIHRIDATLRLGRRTVILGPNGAGKSLFLRLIHGLATPSAGEVRWQGRVLDRAARSRQALVFQRPVILRRSVRANIAFGLRGLGLPRAERMRRIDEALDRAGLGSFAARPARLLSGGEQQRLSIVRALARRPEMLLLDEPTAHLDPAATVAVERLIEDAHVAGVTIVLVTHDRGQAQRLADDVLFLQGGRLAEAGHAAAVLGAPRSEAARAWLDGRLYLEASA